MMRILPILLSIAIVITSCNKDDIDSSGAERIESGTTSRLNRVLSIGNGKVIVTGGQRFLSAEVLRSENGGQEFNISTYPEAGKGLYGLAKNDNKLYSCGNDGKLLVSADTGRSWSFHQLTYWWFYNGIATAGDKLIFTSTDAQNYGTIVRTNAAYDVIDTTNFKFGINDITMATATTGYIAGYGVVLKTTDTGSSWQYLDIKDDNFMSVYALNENEVWTVGYAGSIWHSADGGTNWERQRNGNNIFKKGHAFLNIMFKDSNTGWACGEKGLLVKTEDGGATWSEYDRFTDEAIRDIAFTSTHLITVGDNGNIYRLPL